MTEELTELATEAYVVGFPLVFDLEQVVRFVEEGIGGVPPTPFNVFGHARELAGRTSNNRVVNFAGDPRLIHSYAEVAITHALPHSLRGELIPRLPS